MKIIMQYKFLVLILVLAAILRLWGLGGNPPHLSNDEASLGYNAYSILKTARDEHGEFLPIIFQSFGDWKPGLYIYLDVPFIAILGLTEFAVRLPAALSGIIAVLLVYLLVSRLFNNQRLGVASAFFLTISPWHLQFSRGAWEAGVAFTFVLAGIYFFLRAINGKPKVLVVSAIIFALTLWTYQGAKLSTGIVVAGLILFFGKELFKLPKKIIGWSALLGFLVAFPILLSLTQGKAGRLEVYSIFSYERSPETIQEIIGQEGITQSSPIYFLYHSESLNFFRGILGRWANHYSARFFFFEGDWNITRHSVPNNGLLLLLDAVFLIAGFVALARKGASQSALFIWFLLLFSPLPAALSRDSVHAIRSLSMVIPVSCLLGFGFLFLWDKKREWGRLAKPVLVIFSLFYLANYIYYLDAYWVHAPKRNSQDWQYGYKQMAQKLALLKDTYKEIVVKQDFAQPYIFFLFYWKYDPAKYQATVKNVFAPSEFKDVGLVSRLDNITFREINWSADRGMTGKLFIVDSIKVPIEDSSDPREFKLIDEIKYLNGQSAFRFLEIQ